MATREEIREGITKLLRLHEARLEDIKREERTTEGYIIGEENNRNKTTRAILKLEDDLGVVIKVDRELPENVVQEFSPEYDNGYHEAKMDMLRAGCGFFEPLIKEVSNG